MFRTFFEFYQLTYFPPKNYHIELFFSSTEFSFFSIFFLQTEFLIDFFPMFSNCNYGVGFLPQFHQFQVGFQCRSFDAVGISVEAQAHGFDIPSMSDFFWHSTTVGFSWIARVLAY